MVPSRYTSEAQLRIGGQAANDPFRDPKVGDSGRRSNRWRVKLDKEAIASQVVASASRDLASKLISELKLNAARRVQQRARRPGLPRQSHAHGRPRRPASRRDRGRARLRRLLQGAAGVPGARTPASSLSSSARPTASSPPQPPTGWPSSTRNGCARRASSQTEDASQWLQAPDREARQGSGRGRSRGRALPQPGRSCSAAAARRQHRASTSSS